ncbi:CoA transferase [Parageobacillus sp. SY1]|nr:CoA transferase [Parageobacillus sp. SY1]
MPGALDGVRILDMTRVLAGPYATMILGDLGADVIKVEAPGGSDDTRFWGPPFQNGMSAYYTAVNRNKRSITVNLKEEKGKNIIRHLAKTADVVIHNFKTGTMEKLGLDYDHLSSINSRLIYCSITGFGETGPYRHLPGYDYIIQAMSGWMSINGTASSGPLKVGVAITDVFTGLYAAIAIQAAPNIVPYSTYEASDGPIVIAVGNDRQFQAFCGLLSDPTIGTDPRFQTNPDRVAHREELNNRINEEVKKRTRAEWQRLLAEKGIPCGPVQNLEQLFQHPQTLARDMVITMKHEKVGSLQLVGSPLKLSDTKISYRLPPPLAGEHNDEIIREIMNG